MKLELRGVTKRFGDLVANDGIDLTFEPGTIHALLGENGAGKSTLMYVVFGLLQPDGGEILLDGKPVTFSSPGQAMAAGIGMVHQHFMLIPVFSVAENVMLGHEHVKGGLLDRKAAREEVRRVSERFRLQVDPDVMIENLPVGVQQRVEIIKALVRDAKVLILDEPTAVLTPQETDELLTIMRELRDAGTAIVFITHKLREVREAADVISVIRRGKVVGTATPQATQEELAALMVGRSVSLRVDKDPAQPGATGLVIRGLSASDHTGRAVLDHIDLDVASGEIVVVAGVQGNGQTELVQSLMGLQPTVTGSARLTGTKSNTGAAHSGAVELIGRTTREILGAGVGYVPEDREHDGLVGSFSIAENMILDVFDQPPFATGLALKNKRVFDSAERLVEQFDVRTPSVQTTAGALSGGNKQKVVLARELSRPLDLLIAAQPTRGLDVGSIEFVHKRIVAERDAGAAVLIVSTELDEVVALADRVAVMFRGGIVGIVPADTDRDTLGLMMAGIPAHRPKILQDGALL